MRDKPHISLGGLKSSTSVEWYTPANYVENARAVLGGIDLDPASNFIAQKTVRATVFMTRVDCGLCTSWGEPTWNRFLTREGYIGRCTGGIRVPLIEGRWYCPHNFLKSGKLRKGAEGLTEEEIGAHYDEGRGAGFYALASGGWYDPEAARLNQAVRAS